MKTLTVEVPDDVYERAERRAATLGTSLTREVVETVNRLGVAADDVAIAAARVRMAELFRKVRGFRMTPKIPREELYERGSLS